MLIHDWISYYAACSFLKVVHFVTCQKYSQLREILQSLFIAWRPTVRWYSLVSAHKEVHLRAKSVLRIVDLIDSYRVRYKFMLELNLVGTYQFTPVN